MDPRYFPKVLQAFPTDDFKVYVYFDDGSIKLFDAAPLLKLGEFRKLADPAVFKSAITVLNDTVAWDLTGTFDTTACLDLDPLVLYRCPSVPDPLK